MRRLLVLCLFFPTFALAETGWATTDTEALRWPDATVVSMKVQVGDEVEVLLHDADKVRVRKGTDFGWLAASSISATKPAEATAPPIDAVLPTDAPAEGAPPAEAPAAPN